MLSKMMQCNSIECDGYELEQHLATRDWEAAFLRTLGLTPSATVEGLSDQLAFAEPSAPLQSSPATAERDCEWESWHLDMVKKFAAFDFQDIPQLHPDVIKLFGLTTS